MSNTPMTNQELQLAEDFVEQTCCHIFLTGKAGTGKTTFLKNLQKKTTKRSIVTAPTGVAAINAGGVTLHSFFQLPLGPFVPGSQLSGDGNRYQFKFSREKKEIIKNLDLLVIDEISMVRADILDAVDSVLRRHRGSSLPFGGVQLLMIGDLHQLPPVAKREEWELLRQTYDSVYFFSSRSLGRAGFISIELKQIYRQTDETFIRILNQLRENRLDHASISELNKRYVNGFTPETEQGYIILTTHNLNAESLNNAKLEKLDQKEHYFEAELKGEFPRHSYPAPVDLRLKKGAQVMFLRNDASSDKRYFNGKIGKIVTITSDEIGILCPDDSKAISVEPAIWENIKYSINKEKTKIEADVVGTFKQFPLKLAWAITIHKSQGLTFEKAIIDTEAAFAHGQTYVALSRCKSLDGVVLSSPISPDGIPQDQALRDFDLFTSQNQPSPELLRQAKVEFQQELLLDCFDFKILEDYLYRFVRLAQDHDQVASSSDAEDLEGLAEKATRDIFDIGEKFKRQLQHLFQSGNLPESDPQILERINKASVWFQDKFNTLFGTALENIRFEADQFVLELTTKEVLQHLRKEIMVKLEGIKSLENSFSPSDYLYRIALAKGSDALQKNKNPKSSNSTEPDWDHPELISDLEKWRSQKADKKNSSKQQVLHQDTLVRIALTLPETITELKRIKGIGKRTAQKHGKEIIAIVSRYKEKHGLTGDHFVSCETRSHKQSIYPA